MFLFGCKGNVKMFHSCDTNITKICRNKIVTTSSQTRNRLFYRYLKISSYLCKQILIHYINEGK